MLNCLCEQFKIYKEQCCVEGFLIRTSWVLALEVTMQLFERVAKSEYRVIIFFAI